MKKSTLGAMFWLKHVMLAAVLIVLASILIYMQKSNVSASLPEGAPPTRNINTGLSDFYRDYRRSTTPFENEASNFVLPVNTADRPLEQRLSQMQSLQRPVNENWRGERKFRTFKAGSTLRKELSDAASAEGMSLIWELEQDFIVKHQFQMESTITASMANVAAAIDTSFDGKVQAYMCPLQRALVMTNQKNKYLNINCRVLSASNG